MKSFQALCENLAVCCDGLLRLIENDFHYKYDLFFYFLKGGGFRRILYSPVLNCLQRQNETMQLSTPTFIQDKTLQHKRVLVFYPIRIFHDQDWSVKDKLLVQHLSYNLCLEAPLEHATFEPYTHIHDI